MVILVSTKGHSVGNLSHTWSGLKNFPQPDQNCKIFDALQSVVGDEQG